MHIIPISWEEADIVSLICLFHEANASHCCIVIHSISYGTNCLTYIIERLLRKHYLEIEKSLLTVEVAEDIWNDSIWPQGSLVSHYSILRGKWISWVSSDFKSFLLLRCKHNVSFSHSYNADNKNNLKMRQFLMSFSA